MGKTLDRGNQLTLIQSINECKPSACRANRGALRILKPDVDAAGGHVKLHVGYIPLLAKAKERGIVSVENVFHADIIPQMQSGCMARSGGAVARTPTIGVSNSDFQAALSTKNSEEPKKLGLFCCWFFARQYYIAVGSY